MPKKNDIYWAAWKKLQIGIEAKTSWGRNELKSLMAECLGAALDESLDD